MGNFCYIQSTDHLLRPRARQVYTLTGPGAYVTWSTCRANQGGSPPSASVVMSRLPRRKVQDERPKTRGSERVESELDALIRTCRCS